MFNLRKDNIMKTLDGIEKEIKLCLENVVKEYLAENGIDRDKAGWWTKRIKNCLCQLGHNRNYIVNANGCEAADDNIEWLFDMIWWAGSDYNFEELILAMECEWSLSEYEIWWDFYKLLVVRSKYRVFIFNRSNDELIKNMFDQFKETIKNFKSSNCGDRYLLAGYSPTKVDFIFEHLVVPYF